MSNAKNWQVKYRDNAAERAGKKAFGCVDVDVWEVSPKFRLTQADRLIDRLERIGYEYQLINLNLQGDK